MATMYAMMNAPPVIMASATAASRTRVGSTLRDSAIPPHTPLILRSVCERRSCRYEGVGVMSLQSRIEVPPRLGDRPDEYPEICPPIPVYASLGHAWRMLTSWLIR